MDAMRGEIVTDEDAAEDREWFAAHPNENYRMRETRGAVWLVRRRTGGELLRTPLRSRPATDGDVTTDLRTLWFDTAWGDLDADLRKNLIGRARANEAQKKKKR
jgi:hypothetical protein